MSGGMLLACPLKPEDGNVPARGVYEIVLTCATMMLAQRAAGRPIRGGIDVGTGIEIDRELFGAAIVKAYEIESSRAGYPLDALPSRRPGGGAYAVTNGHEMGALRVRAGVHRVRQRAFARS
jgi:hypothetical protein